MFIKILAALGNKADGKKTWAGLGLTLLGVALFWTAAAPVAPKIVEGGLVLTGVGVIHKAQKKTGGK